MREEEFTVAVNVQGIGRVRTWATSPSEAVGTITRAFPKASLATVTTANGKTLAFAIDRRHGPRLLEEDAEAEDLWGAKS